LDFPTPTCLNPNVAEGVRLDYVWVKGMAIITEDADLEKKLWPYALKYYSYKEIPWQTKKNSKELRKLPLSDHSPLFYRLSVYK